MPKIIIFANNFRFQNVQSFIIPFIKFNDFFYKNNLYFKFKELNLDIKDSNDIFFLESKEAILFSRKKKIKIIDLIKNLSKRTEKLVFFDTSDSTEIELPEIIPYVHKYCKAQVLKNKKNYKKKFYGGRIFTDFVFKNFGVNDIKPRFSKKLSDNEIKKICIFWNSSINNFSFDRIFTSYLYRFFKKKTFLKLPSKGFNPLRKRKKFISLNFNINYSRDTIAWHRKKTLNLTRSETLNKKNFFLYFYDLLNTKYVLSPFGWGEINYRDYESFLSGSVLIKPNMDHVDTWPNYYLKKKFYIDYDWSCNDFLEILGDLEMNYPKYVNYAKDAQKFYLETLNHKTLKYKILKRIINIIN